jgi:hypothetical protein
VRVCVCACVRVCVSVRDAGERMVLDVWGRLAVVAARVLCAQEVASRAGAASIDGEDQFKVRDRLEAEHERALPLLVGERVGSYRIVRADAR